MIANARTENRPCGNLVVGWQSIFGLQAGDGTRSDCHNHNDEAHLPQMS